MIADLKLPYALRLCGPFTAASVKKVSLAFSLVFSCAITPSGVCIVLSNEQSLPTWLCTNSRRSHESDIAGSHLPLQCCVCVPELVAPPHVAKTLVPLRRLFLMKQRLLILATAKWKIWRRTWATDSVEAHQRLLRIVPEG